MRGAGAARPSPVRPPSSDTGPHGGRATGMCNLAHSGLGPCPGTEQSYGRGIHSSAAGDSRGRLGGRIRRRRAPGRDHQVHPSRRASVGSSGHPSVPQCHSARTTSPKLERIPRENHHTDMGRRTRFLVLLLALTSAACSGREAVVPPGVFFPTVPIGDAYPAALIDGHLEVRSGCVFVAATDERWLLLWPEGYTARLVDRRLEALNGSGEVIGREGEAIRLGGGETRPREVGGEAAAERWASELTGLDIPERCGDLYWIVSP